MRRTYCTHTLGLLAVAALAAACSGEDDGGGKGYEYRPPYDVSAVDPGADAVAGEDAPPPDDAPVADDVAGAPDADTSGLPVIPCDGDATCKELLASLTGECAVASCQDSRCVLTSSGDGTPCDDGIACTQGDACEAGQCRGVDVVCDDGQPCTVDVCQPATGTCQSSPLDGAQFPCDDGKACTVSDHCQAGACAGVARSCDDGEPCTVDSCIAATGLCAHDGAAMQNKPCDDKSLCTSGETCQQGSCRGAEKDCDDGEPCTADSCLPSTGACTHGYSAAVDGLACDDGQPCTVEDVCVMGQCVGADMACPTGACLVSECIAGSCSPPVPAADGTVCSDGAPCTLDDACSQGSCVGVARDCDDGNGCTMDACEPALGCVHSPSATGAPCDDGDACTTGDVCAASGCSGAPKVCDDGKVCTVDTCNGATGNCASDAAALNGAACDADNVPCTSGGVCTAGNCVGEVATDCEDGNPCTLNSCDPTSGQCLSTPGPNGTPCQDGLVCTAVDACKDGVCAGPTRTCDDGNECTADSCTEATGCIHTAIGGCQKPLHPCNVSSARSSSDAAVTQCVCALDSTCCGVGWGPACVALAQSACGVSCGTCASPVVSCKVDADCGFCDADGDRCNGGYACQGGVCKATAAVSCAGAEDVGCLRTRCNPDNGECIQAPRADLCDDGEVCTTDSCSQTGVCSATPRPNCGEQHPCAVSPTGGSDDASVTACVCALIPSCCTTAWTAACVDAATDSCGEVCDCAALPSAATACSKDADCAKCDDGDLCNGRWRCDAGQCKDSGPVSCSGHGCLAGACNPDTGTCVLTPVPSQCDDGDGCTSDVCITTNGACTHHPVPGCGLQGPCTTSNLARSSNKTITACVCDTRPECCSGAWTSECVNIAHFGCGAVCGCVAEPPSCNSNADCASCDDANQCNGGWVCAGGVCTATAGVVCDTAGDTGCYRNSCNPANGLCAPKAVDLACDDGLPCTVDACQGGGGTCSHTESPSCGANHPCQVSSLPEASDPAVTACVCALDPSCCTGAWSDACVALAMSACGQSCDCSALPPSAKSCTSTEDCWVCNESPCTGDWTCQAGQCVSSGAVSCSGASDRGCVQNRCNPLTGGCELSAQNAACPGVGCLGGVCAYDTGTCGYARIPGCTGAGDLCSRSPVAATPSAEVAACVCGFDAFCCAGAWDQACADQAVQLCGLKCACDALAPAQLACTADADCAGCDEDGDKCNGGWRCQAGTCVVTPPVSCGPAGGGCNAVSCEPKSGQCVAGGKPGACDDGNPCTLDVCSASTGLCSHDAISGCGANTPCTAAPTPGSSSASANACVCALAPECCSGAWTAACVNLAQSTCNVTCDGCPAGGCAADPLAPDCPVSGCTGTTQAAMLCAMDVCFEALAVDAGLAVTSPTQVVLDDMYGALAHYGDVTNGLAPRSGLSYLALATGGLSQRPHSDDRSATSSGNPVITDPWTASSSPAQIRDVVEFALTLHAPPSATGFSLDTLFMSVEYPTYIGSDFIDAFYVILEAPVTTSGAPLIINAGACAVPGQYVDYFEDGEPRCYTGINSSFAESCEGAVTNLAGTGFECGPVDNANGSSTGWLRTTWPIQGGELFTLRFHIHDAVDGGFDSAALIDRFRWLTGPVVAETVKAPNGG